MTDAQINLALALSIGYLPEHVRQAPDASRVVEINRPGIYGDSWYRMDFTSAETIWPIAERYNLFPYLITCGSRDQVGKWNSIDPNNKDHIADTAAKAVALAVIGSKT